MGLGLCLYLTSVAAIVIPTKTRVPQDIYHQHKSPRRPAVDAVVGRLAGILDPAPADVEEAA